MPFRRSATTAVSALAALCLALIVAPAAQAAPDGAALFRQRCQGCHTVKPGEAGAIAPNLSGVVGRRSASTAYHYSAALTASKLVWSKAALGTFLSGPQKLVPGTRMVIQVSDPAERAAIIDFLSRTGH